MSYIGKILKTSLVLRQSLEQDYTNPDDLQFAELKRLMISARNTAFGKKYNFKDLLKAGRSLSTNSFYGKFTSQVPIHDYNKMHNEWWHRSLEGEKDISWPGKVKYFAMSSGTSEAASKYIPVTNDMLVAMKKTSTRQLLCLAKYDFPDSMLGKDVLGLGGSTDLTFNKTHFEGDLSGITASRPPFWIRRFYKPGTQIAKTRDWNKKLDAITEQAKDWDVSIIIGVPAWIQLLLEKIITHYQVDHIHQIWPNLNLFVHGGVAFEPYRKGFEKLLGKEILYVETYLASEGFIAFQARPDTRAMKLIVNNGLFFEFIPFNTTNFTAEGQLVSEPEVCHFGQVEENKEYALVLTTCAGAWRYLIGDVIRFTSLEKCELVITGRTKHFLSLCGEHLSVENMNTAVSFLEKELNVNIREFTVIGKPHDGLFAHHWFLGTDDPVDSKQVRKMLDEQLKLLNDDYRTERGSALKDIFVDILPSRAFYSWMKAKGKEGGQHKFPRVLKKEMAQDWLNFVNKWEEAD